MIRTVFFDFYGTLAKWAPDAEQIQRAACAAEGIEVSLSDLTRGYRVANSFLDAENARHPIRQWPQHKRDAFFAEYERRLLTTAGVDVDLEIAGRVWERVRATPKGLALYEDAAPALRDLRAAGLTLGIISNIGIELGELIQQLGLADTVTVWASSAEAGVNKPNVGIFRLALSKAAAQPREAMHVGDSYESDIVGARKAALHPLLLWRAEDEAPPTDVPSVRSLMEVRPYLEGFSIHARVDGH